MGAQGDLFQKLVGEGFTELKGEGSSDSGEDDLFQALAGESGFSLLGPPARRKARPKHYRIDFLCSVCAQQKNGTAQPLCGGCSVHLGRIMAVYTEAAMLIPSVRTLKLSEFVERLWQREKERRKNAPTEHRNRNTRRKVRRR